MTSDQIGLSLCAALALTVGCGGGGDPLYFSDDMDLELNFSLFGDAADELHLPYVQGAEVQMYLNGDRPMPGWTLESSNPEVFRIDAFDAGHRSAHTAGAAPNYLYAKCRAVAAGIATITARNERGKRVTEATVEVAQPDRVEVLAHGPLMIHHPEEEARVEREARILVGGQATFLIQYFEEDRLLFGNGVLSVEAPEAITATPLTTFLFENREWLALTPETDQTGRVALFADGIELGQLDVMPVPASAIDHTRLVGMNERKRDRGEWLVVLARAFDADGNPIYGIDYAWDRDGFLEEGAGDLYRYEYIGGRPQMLTAEFSDHQASTMIRAGEGYVDSTNDVGCQAGGKSGVLQAITLLFCIGAMYRRRR